MGLEQTPRKPRSPLARYAPLIVIGVIAAVIVGAIAMTSGGDDGDDKVQTQATTTPGTDASGKPVPGLTPMLYNTAKANGTLDKYGGQANCDTETG